MCYSAQIWSECRRYARELDAIPDVREFFALYRRRFTDPKVKIPRGMDAGFERPSNEEEQRIHALIHDYNAHQLQDIEQEISRQRKRLADAERTLQSKVTKRAMADRRIATDKISRGLAKLADLNRSELKARDSRIFPGHHAPVLVMENGRRVVKPMRYQCRPSGKPASHDIQYPGTYNARKDNLQGFWKDLFGHTHAVMVVDAFYENVRRPEGNVVLEFRPRTVQPIFVACLWSRWTGDEGENELLSFAAITDDPPPEVAAAGHDRCIVAIKLENIDRWLQPDKARLEEQLKILEEPVRPYYEHRLAA